MAINKKVSERLKYYGFKLDRMGVNDANDISSLIIQFITERNYKTARSCFSMLAYYAQKHFSVLNVALLQLNREAIHGKPVKRARKVKTVINITITVKHEIINKDLTSKRSKTLARNYQARKTNIVNKTNILSTCSICGITAMNERDLKLVFGVNMIDRKIKMICEDCKQ